MKDTTYFTRFPNSTLETTPLVIYEDDGTFWGVWENGVGGHRGIVATEDTTNQIKGDSCLNMAYSDRGFTDSNVYHTYGVDQDWSGYDVLSLYINGSSSTVVTAIDIADATWANRISVGWVDNWSGWAIRHFRLRTDFTWLTAGDLETCLSHVRTIQFARWTDSPPNATIKIDRVVADVFPPWAPSFFTLKKRRTQT